MRGFEKKNKLSMLSRLSFSSGFKPSPGTRKSDAFTSKRRTPVSDILE